MYKHALFIISTLKNVYLDENILILSGLGADILTFIYIFCKMAASQLTGHFFNGSIGKNILKGVLLQHVKFHAFIIK